MMDDSRRKALDPLSKSKPNPPSHHPLILGGNMKRERGKRIKIKYNLTKGKIGEWIARDYFRQQGYIVWFLEQRHHGSFYSGTGKEYYNDRLVLTPLEKSLLSRIRTFDLLIIPEKEIGSIKHIIKNYDKLKSEWDRISVSELIDRINNSNSNLSNLLSKDELNMWNRVSKLNRTLVDVKAIFGKEGWKYSKDEKIENAVTKLRFKIKILEMRIKIVVSVKD